MAQFFPPRSAEHPRGVEPFFYPNGAWYICKPLKRSGCLHPRIVWSLTDRNGNFAPPGPDTIRLIRLAHYLDRRGRMEQMEDEMDRVMNDLNRNKAAKSKQELRDRLCEMASRAGQRQWTNRVSLMRSKDSVETMTV